MHVRTAAVALLLAAPAPRSVPALEWAITNLRTGRVERFRGSAEVQVGRRDRFRVTVTARDPRGLRRLILGGTERSSCTTERVGADAPPEENRGPCVIEQRADTLRLRRSRAGSLRRELSFEWKCEAPFDFHGGSVELRAEAANASGRVRRGELVVHVQP